jgi:hypothetical protein
LAQVLENQRQYVKVIFKILFLQSISIIIYKQAITMYYSLLKVKNDEKNVITVGSLIKLLIEESGDEIMVVILFYLVFSYFSLCFPM